MKKIVLLTFIVSSIMFSQSKNNLYLSGSLINDTQFALTNLQDSSESSKFNFSKKTPMLAGLMSFAVPGAGQIYTENYLKAGIFVAVEVGAIVLAAIYNNKGDDQTEFFENYANDNWSASRYALWTTNNLSSLNINLDANEYDIFDLEGNVNWNELNRLESAIGGYYSHKLAPFDDQQYYEMIGKYSQFNVGWIDFGDENTPYVWATDPLVDQFKYYSKERGKANDYYTVAKWAVIAIVSNHFVSALDAAWSANKYNKKLNLNISVEEETIGFYKEYYPQINLSYNL
jgi:Family of unknown function (DUF5683)